MSLCSARGSSEALHSTTAGHGMLGGEQLRGLTAEVKSQPLIFSFAVFYAKIFHSLQGELNYS